MFTGIVEEVGSVNAVERRGESSVLKISAQKVLEGTEIGDSICVSGVCLTVTHLSDSGFEADVMPETFERSTLCDLRSMSPVNLERAARIGDRLGGHIVTGHIDGTAVVSATRKDGNALRIRMKAPSDILKLVVEKGSVALNGISLTVTDVDDETFEVSVIPHTLENTDLEGVSGGRVINVECDIIGKYVEKLMYDDNGCADRASSDYNVEITREFLLENGF